MSGAVAVGMAAFETIGETLLTTGLGSALAGGAASALIGKSLAPKAPNAPTPIPTALAPTMDSSLIAQAQQRSAAAQQATSGRASTILSGTTQNDRGTLGG